MSDELAEHTPRVVSADAFHEHGTVISVDGDLDLATAPELGNTISDQITDGHRHFVIDLSAATFLDSTAMGMLLYAIAPLRDDADAAVVLAGVHGIVERSLGVSGIGTMFTTFDTRETAIAGLDGTTALCGTWRTLRPRPNQMP